MSTEKPKTSREARRDKVKAAWKEARGLYAEAMASDTEAAWEAFELQAAVLHRQSRLLAGKARGG